MDMAGSFKLVGGVTQVQIAHALPTRSSSEEDFLRGSLRGVWWSLQKNFFKDLFYFM